MGLKISVSKTCWSIKVNIIRLASSYLGDSGGILKLIGGIGLLPLCGRGPWANKNGVNQAPNGSRPMPPISPRMPPEAPKYEPAGLIMLIFVDQNGFDTKTLRPNASNRGGGKVCNRSARECSHEGPMLSPSTDGSNNWKPWVSENGKNQACKLPLVSTSCPIGGWRTWATEHDENQACKLLGVSSGSSAASASCPI